MAPVGGPATASGDAAPRGYKGVVLPGKLGVVVLAAGQGVRMKSRLHKVLHPIAGLPMIDHVLRAAEALAPHRLTLVVGHGAEQVRAHLGDRVGYAVQDPPLGTGDAVRVARGQLEGSDTVLVLYGDTPLMSPDTLRRLVETHERDGALITVLTADSHDPGRVLRDAQGRFVGVAQEKLATPEQLRIPERHSGVSAFKGPWLWPELDRLERSELGEYLLTDLLERAMEAAEPGGPWPLTAVRVEDPSEAMGVNNRAQLAEAEAALRRSLLQRLMLSGVTVTDPATTYVGVDVAVGPDTTLLPGTHLSGSTSIGSGCIVGPGAQIADSEVGDDCRVRWSVLQGVVMEPGSDAGPYAHLRPGTRIGRGAHIGTFVETKNTQLGEGSALAHLSYMGDTEIGRGVNVGAGTINANYDHTTKHKAGSKIGDGASIGSDTMLVAPVRIGAGARTGAGAVVTKDVPPGRLAVGVPARLVPEADDGGRHLKHESAGEGQ
jgi:bifunctional UDP-N-acetylglucosamine pyrophosphorylase/glucosamine-1-phosphate N-acetyltransferase